MYQDSLKDGKQKVVSRYEKEFIEAALKDTDGNVAAAARLSGKNRRALFELIRKYGIDTDKYRVAHQKRGR